MSFAWRNHPIELLHSAEGEHLPPTFADWELWKNGTERKMGAVGAAYIRKMIDLLDWDGAGLPQFIEPPPANDPNRVPVLISNPTSLAYKTEIVKLALSAGRTFTTFANPIVNEATVNATYATVEQEVISFGAQLFMAAKKHFSTVFSDASRATYNLKPLLEWKVIEKYINPKAKADIGKSWIELGNLVQFLQCTQSH